MFPRRLFIPSLLAAVGVPYAMMREDQRQVQTATKSGISKHSSYYNGITSPGVATGIPLAGKPGMELHQLFRFNISPHWVTANWPRVSTIQTSTNLQGLRIPVVTGTQKDALVGVLTYYFDSQDRLVRISFQGHTGDERPLVQYCLKQFELRVTPKLGSGMYAYKRRGRPLSLLRVRRAPVIRASTPNASLEVSLELNHPRLSRELSSKFRNQL
ncbi:MAG: hypothetical protein CMJ75_09620 [Planctomycetaceae bacterium]|nr:hypothetical protein [Planctomycetaceae bacterium]